MHRHRDAQKGVDGLEFFTHQAQRNVVKAGAAVFFRYAHAQQVQGGHLFEDPALEMLFLVPFLDVRGDFFLRKLPHGLNQRLVFFGQFELDHVCSLFQIFG